MCWSSVRLDLIIVDIFTHPHHTHTSGMAKQFVEDKIASNKVVVFSKTYCPFCTMAKQSIRDAGLQDFAVVEIEDRSELQLNMLQQP